MVEKRSKTVRSGLTATQEKLLVALLSCATHKQAAEQAGMSERSLRRHLRAPGFHEEFLRRRREIVSSAVTLTQQRAPVAVAVLVTIASDNSNPPSVRVSAASKLVDVAMKGVETEDLAEQVAELQEEIDSLKTLAQLLPPPPLEQPTNGNSRRRYAR